MTNFGSTALVDAPRERRPSEQKPERDDDYCLTTAELVECTCPDFCERDHDTD